jgi:hypothetical protein
MLQARILAADRALNLSTNDNKETRQCNKNNASSNKKQLNNIMNVTDYGRFALRDITHWERNVKRIDKT